MSKFAVFGSFLGGVGATAAAALSLFQYFDPTEISTPKDLIAALANIETALREQEFSVSDDQISELKSALGGVDTGIARAVTNQEGGLPFVPRSYSGVQRIEQRTPQDYVAPNDATIPLLFRYYSGSGLRVSSKGEILATSLKLGDSFKIAVGTQTCEFEFIALDDGQRGPVTVRSACT